MAGAPGAAVRWLPSGSCPTACRPNGEQKYFQTGRAEPFLASPLTRSLGPRCLTEGLVLSVRPRSLDHAGSQWQSIAELRDPSCHLTAWFAFGYLREARATFEFRFVSALGRCGAGSALYRQVRWQVVWCCKPGGEEVTQSRNWFSCISVGKKNILGWRSRGWKLVPVEPAASGCCLNLMLPCTIGAAVACSLWCIVKHEQTDDLHIKRILVNTEHLLIYSGFSAFPVFKMEMQISW